MDLVSIIIPVHNDPKGLQITLDSVIDQTYNNYEILVIDNDSTDSTQSVAEKYAIEYPELMTVYVENEIQSSYAARNKGIQNANGSILAFIDADMTVERDWLESGVNAMETRNAKYMGCNVGIYIPEGERTIFGEYNMYTGFPVQRYVEESSFVPTCCLFAKKKVFDEIGLFNSRLTSGGDLKFGKKVRDAGIQLHYEPEVTMYHPARTTYQALRSKYYRIGKGLQERINIGITRTTSVYHPINYLPPHPGVFLEKIPSKELSCIRITLLYFVSYLMKLHNFKGRLDEKFRYYLQNSFLCSFCIHRTEDAK